MGHGCSAFKKIKKAREDYTENGVRFNQSQEEFCAVAADPTTKDQTPLIIALGASLGTIVLLVGGFMLYRYRRNKNNYTRAGSFGDTM